MIIASCIHTENTDTPNTGSNLHLTNQVGQEDFKLGGGITLRNTDPTEYKATLNIRQALLNVGDDTEVSSFVKDVAVAIPGGKGAELSAALVGSIPMKTVDTAGKSYRYRLTIKSPDALICDSVTGLSFNVTDTLFTSESAPFAGPVDTNGSAKAELAAKEVAMAANVKVISKAQDEIKVLQPRIDRLRALLA